MNTQLSILAHTGSARVSRAQLSPLLRRGVRSALTRLTTGRSHSATAATTLPHGPQLRPVLAWHRGFLDRVQPELTRYHE